MALSLMTVSLGLLAPVAWATTFTFPNVLVNDSISVQAIAPTGPLEGPKILPGANQTSFDQWYWDVVSVSTNASVQIALYNAGPDAFLNDYLNGPLSATISGSYANGSHFSLEVPVTGDVILEVDDNEVSGNWQGAGFNFSSTGFNTATSKSIVHIDSPSIGVQGTVTLQAKVAGRFPCGPSVPGASEELLPNVYWYNAIPDADAVVDLTVGGTAVKIDDGLGFHDKFWSDQPIVDTIAQWYFGHARAGPYSVVWYNSIDGVGTEHFSGYVAKNGEVLLDTCAKDAGLSRPWGFNDEYPPTSTTGVMQGLGVTFGLPDDSTLLFNVTTGLVLVDAGFYVRAEASVTATIDGSTEVYEGRALMDQIKFAGSSLVQY